MSDHIHRLYVSGDRRLEGVLGTRELMQAVIAARIAVPCAAAAPVPQTTAHRAIAAA